MQPLLRCSPQNKSRKWNVSTRLAPKGCFMPRRSVGNWQWVRSTSPPNSTKHGNRSYCGNRSFATSKASKSAHPTQSKKLDNAESNALSAAHSTRRSEAGRWQLTSGYEKLKPVAEHLRAEHLWNLANNHSEHATEDSRKHAKQLLREKGRSWKRQSLCVLNWEQVDY